MASGFSLAVGPGDFPEKGDWSCGPLPPMYVRGAVKSTCAAAHTTHMPIRQETEKAAPVLIFLLFLAIPLIEIALFITIGGWLTLWPTLALVVVTAVIGSALVRQQGLAAIGQIQRATSELRDPTAPIAHGAMILLAGFLLITPGFFTDTLGFLLLVPPVRAALLRQIAARIVVLGTRSARPHPGFGGPPRWPDAHEDVIDGDATEIRPETRPLPGDRHR